jgi:type II secretory pathway predicted ATPase ExeA
MDIDREKQLKAIKETNRLLHKTESKRMLLRFKRGIVDLEHKRFDILKNSEFVEGLGEYLYTLYQKDPEGNILRILENIGYCGCNAEKDLRERANIILSVFIERVSKEENSPKFLEAVARLKIMYTSYYNLKIKPFQMSSDAVFIWLGEKHKEALASFRHEILDNKGFLLLTGDVGTGKTTLINALIASLSNEIIYASVPDPSLDKLDFFNYIAAAFGISGEFASKGKFLASFSTFLQRAYENKKKVLLIIDESQHMTQDLLEEIRLLSNIVTTDNIPLLNVFFVGQDGFNEIIRRPENRAVAQRITLNCRIEPLTVEETGKYIQHRLRIAGTTEKIFNTSAVKAIYNFSEGFPRKINIICDRCLMCGYAEDQKIISSSIVKESTRDLQIPERKKEEKPESQVTAQQPEVTVQQPQVTEQQLEVAVQQPQVTEQQPQVTEQQPQVTEQQPQVTVQRPQEQPQVVVRRPQVAVWRPQVAVKQPQVTVQRPQFTVRRPSVSPEIALDQATQAQFSQQAKVNRRSLTWPTKGLFLIILFLISFGFTFLYFSNTTYQDAIAYFASFREKIDTSTLLPSGENIQPEPKDKPVLIEKNNTSKVQPASKIPLPAKAKTTAEKNEQTSSFFGLPGQMNHEAEEISGPGEKELEAVMPESVPVWLASHSLIPKNDSFEESAELLISTRFTSVTRVDKSPVNS